MQAIVIGVVLLIFGLFALMNLIEIAVRNGINSSIIGKSFEKKNEVQDDGPLLNQELDKDK